MGLIKALAITAAGYVVYSTFSGLKNAVESLKVFVTNPSKVRISGGMLLIDVMVNVSNGSSQTLPLEALQVVAYRGTTVGDKTTWSEFATSTPELSGLTFAPFKTTRFPVTMQTSLMQGALEVWGIVSGGGMMKFKFAVTPTFLGLRIPPIQTDVFEFNAGAFIPKGKDKAEPAA